jgi:hypothetical protein
MKNNTKIIDSGKLIKRVGFHLRHFKIKDKEMQDFKNGFIVMKSGIRVI